MACSSPCQNGIDRSSTFDWLGSIKKQPAVIPGGRVEYTIKTESLIFTPHLSASWQHEFMDQSRGITSQFSDLSAGSFVVNTPNPSRESALVDVGLDAQINNMITVFMDYSAQAGQSNYLGQSVQAGVKIGF